MIIQLRRKKTCEGNFFMCAHRNRWFLKTIDGEELEVKNPAKIPDFPVSFYEVEYFFKPKQQDKIWLRLVTPATEKEAIDLSMAY